MLGSFILYLKGMRTTMFQLSGFYYNLSGGHGLRFLGLGRVPGLGLRSAIQYCRISFGVNNPRSRSPTVPCIT